MNGTPNQPDITFLDRPEVLRYVFHPHRTAPLKDIPGKRIGLTFQVDEKINVDGIMHLADVSSANILFFHGNGEMAADYSEIGQFYTDMGINFAVIDYRGYGTSGGIPTYSSMISDAHAIFHQFLELLSERRFTGPVFVMGRSLGSASALEIAANYGDLIKGLILESGFAHTYNLLTTLGADPRLLNPSKEALVSNLEKMKSVSAPVLFIHGEIDALIPASNSYDLYEAALSELKEMLMIPGAGHNTLLLIGLRDYMNAIASFIFKVLRL
jgi:alpha-beta hydrolase superfamily lysophospholipase